MTPTLIRVLAASTAAHPRINLLGLIPLAVLIGLVVLARNLSQRHRRRAGRPGGNGRGSRRRAARRPRPRPVTRPPAARPRITRAVSRRPERVYPPDGFTCRAAHTGTGRTSRADQARPGMRDG